MKKILFAPLLLGLALAGCSSAPPRQAAPTVAEFPVPDVEPASATLADLLKQIETAYRRGNYALGLSLVKKAFELKQNDVSAMDRIGSIYYVLGRYGEAITVWTRALPYEHDPARRRELENSIMVTRRGLGLDEPAFAVSAASATAAAVVTPPASKELSPETKAKVEALYKLGVKYYASGQYLQATTTFRSVLALDPGNPDATKALKRLKLDQ
ncbi:MAG: hypothetical protein KGL74_14825 [Elusimicrobia bacterium]|nr:hypothetical protein [Elusimicrobiota bacterium]MDE2512397.1 hypothetical protein [Elusimicrobiota bacterium]